MKTTIYYFSATGNSLYVAKSLADKLGECQLVSISALRENESITTDAERIGIVFPTHYFGLPPLVGEFIGKLQTGTVKYTFAIVTSGSSRHLNSALQEAIGRFAAKGCTLNAGFHVNMISNYLPLSNLPPAHKIKQKLAKAELAIEQAANAIQSLENTAESERFWKPFRAINRYWQKRLLPKSYRKFSCSDACISCGSCAKICPVENIRLSKGKPEWRQDCQECLACLHICPVKSIEFGTKTAGRTRYRHPGILAAELIAKK